jgi:hypothetical protein
MDTLQPYLHIKIDLCTLFFGWKQSVRAYIYKHPSGDDPIKIVPLEEEHGVWRTKGPKSWEGCYYVYEVCVYHPSTSRVEKCYANDPYARGYA